MDTNPVFSIIIPAYNAQATIGKAIESILAQSYPHYEIIVVDDRSKDETAETARQSVGSAKLTVQTNTRPQGPAGARNHGLDIATGDFVAFLDADDKWLPNHLDEAAAFFKTKPDADVVFFNFSIHDLDDNELGDWFSNKSWLRAPENSTESDGYSRLTIDIRAKLLSDSFFHLQSVALRRSTCGDIRFDEHLSIGEDRDFALRIATRCSSDFHFKDVVTGVYYRHDDSLTSNTTANNIKALKGRSGAFGKYLAQDEYAAYRQLIKSVLRETNLDLAYYYRLSGSKTEARRALRESIRHGLCANQFRELLKLLLSGSGR